MKSTSKNRKHPLPKKLQLPLNQQLNIILKSINIFLKKYFEIADANLTQYKERVKQFFIRHSTNVQYSCAISSLFSKLGNMLQPFLHIISHTQVIEPITTQYHSSNNNLTHSKIDLKTEVEYQLESRVGFLENRNRKLDRKIKQLKDQLSGYRTVNIRLTNFVYMLRVNNIDVDGLYEKGCLHMEPKAKKMSVLGDHIVEEDTRNFMKDPEKERGKNIFDNYVTN